MSIDLAKAKAMAECCKAWGTTPQGEETRDDACCLHLPKLIDWIERAAGVMKHLYHSYPEDAEAVYELLKELKTE